MRGVMRGAGSLIGVAVFFGWRAAPATGTSTSSPSVLRSVRASSCASLRNIAKRYGDNAPVIQGINLDIADGEFTVFVGPSGCGKSTLLRMIAGLEEISGGQLHIGGQLANSVPPAERGLAMVFQSYALYPHMTVYEKIGRAHV